MCGGGKKKRRDLRAGQEQFNQFAGQAINQIKPYAEGGLPAFGNANAFLGLGTDEQNAAARARFEASPFFTGGENAFRTERDAVDAGLSSGGLLFSQARLNAVEDARRRSYQNALSQYLGLNQSQSGLGVGAATGVANILGSQGQAALNTAQNIASTRQGFLGTLGQIAGIGNAFGQAYTGFSDRRLKSDISKIDQFGPLAVYLWRWNEDAEALGLSGEDVGFMADEVERLLPEAVGVRAGYKTVDYAKVMERYSQ